VGILGASSRSPNNRKYLDYGKTEHRYHLPVHWKRDADNTAINQFEKRFR